MDNQVTQNVNHYSSTNNNSNNNITNNSNTNNINNIPTNEVGKPISLRKSLEFNKLKINEELLKKGAAATNNIKPNLFKNLSKNLNLTSKLALNQKSVKRNDSGLSGTSSVKTNEN
jgi:hypothetical protein